MTVPTPIPPAATFQETPVLKPQSTWWWWLVIVLVGLLGLAGGYYWGWEVGKSQILESETRRFGPADGGGMNEPPPFESLTSVEATPPAIIAVAPTTDFNGPQVQVLDLSVLPPKLAEVTWSDQELIITSAPNTKYSLTGSFAGQVTFTGTTPMEIELNEVTIINEAGPALVLQSLELATVTLRAGTVNVLADGGQNEDYDAALFSVGPLAINGAGALTVRGNYQEGIASDANLIIQNGQLDITAADDGLNAQSDISINGGQLFVSAAGDGIDSNGTLNVTAGVVLTQGSLADASGGLDADGAIVFSGGVIVATGSQNALPQNSASQKFLLANLNQILPSGSVLTLAAAEQALLSFTLSQDTQQLVFSLPQIQEGVNYQVYVNSNAQTSAALTLEPTGVDFGTLLVTVNSATSMTQGRGRPVGGRPPAGQDTLPATIPSQI